ncbi:MAG: adenine-specific methyltransferase EcoRI family protein [Lactobacillus iners]|nr:adenine-specific methyltransferase EcoRI family protein [Lactobacillus iners]
MADNSSLSVAKNAKNDEFYTQYSDIEAEMNAYIEYNPEVFKDKTILLPCDDPEWSNFTKYFASNFTRLGIKKLISTSYAKGAANKQPTLFELESPLYNPQQHDTHGKLFTLTRDTDGNGTVDTDDIEFTGYLEGDGDFRSNEVKKLRDEADIIITNPPFSLFREFLAWILEAQKQFVIIGNKNIITYKDVFPLLSNNEIWLGPGFPGGNAFFKIANKCVRNFAAGVYDDDTGLVKFRNVGWFTNIDHGKRHKNLILDTMEHNLKFNKKLKNKLEKEYGKLEYPHYDNYDAIEVPFTECIPSDYDGVMGVPITFLDKYNPDQFDIVALGNSRDNFTPNKDYVNPKKIMRNGDIKNGNAINCVLAINCCMKPADIYYIADNADYLTAPYARVLICAKRNK